MQNPIQKLRQISIVFAKQGILSENLKTLMSSNYPTVQYFCWNFAHVSYLPMSTKGCFCKKMQKLKSPDFYIFNIFISNSRSKQNKKNPEYPFLDIIK